MSKKAPKMNKLKYYDFYVGLAKESPKDWKYQAWKVAAYNPLTALHIKRLLSREISSRTKQNFSLGKENLYSSYLSVRRIVEFEIAKIEGKTKYRFKKVREFTLNERLKITENV